MRILPTIFFTLALTLMFGACNDTADLNQEQRDDITSYLTSSSHSPALLSEADAKISVELAPAFYTTTGSTVFRYVETWYDEERESMPQIKKGSNISITFTIYDFEDITTPTITEVLYSNDATIIAELETYGLNPEYWSTTPLNFNVGSGTLFGGVESMLIGCYQGDIIEFYLTLDEAYGGSGVIGLSTLEAPIAFYCEVIEVN